MEEIINISYRNENSLSYKLKRIYRKHNTQKIKRWTKEESDLYNRFIMEHSDLLQDPSVKRAKKIFILMSNFIKTKNPSQCRSHHQKFYRKDASEENFHMTKSENFDFTLEEIKETEKINENFLFKQKMKMEKPFDFHVKNQYQNLDFNEFVLKEKKTSEKFQIQREESKNNKPREEIEKINKLTEKELDDFIYSAQILFDVNSQMHKLRKNFEEFENNNLKVFKDSCM